MKILLAGRNGQLGRELQQSLAATGEVVACSRDELDITDQASITRAMRSLTPDLIVNAAGYTWVDGAEDESSEAFAANGHGPLLLAQAARTHGAAIVHFSTDYVFDGSKNDAYVEDDEPNPLSVYGRSKLAGEEAVLSSGAHALVLRLSWLYSAHGRNFFRTILRKAETELALRIVNEQFGSPTWARTVARWTAEIIRGFARRDGGEMGFSDSEGVYHLACSGRTTWFDFARRIIELADLNAPPAVTPISAAEYPTPARRPRQSVLCSDKAIRAFGLTPVPWEDALREATTEMRGARVAQHAEGGARP